MNATLYKHGLLYRAGQREMRLALPSSTARPQTGAENALLQSQFLQCVQTLGRRNPRAFMTHAKLHDIAFRKEERLTRTVGRKV